LAEKGVGAFGDVAEPVPAAGGVRVEAGGFFVTAGCFGELSAAAGEGVVAEGVERLDTVEEVGG
jgi:hypothetical protein